MYDSSRRVNYRRYALFLHESECESTAGPRGGKKCEDGEGVLDKDAVCHRFCSAYTAGALDGSPCRGFFGMAR